MCLSSSQDWQTLLSSWTRFGYGHSLDKPEDLVTLLHGCKKWQRLVPSTVRVVWKGGVFSGAGKAPILWLVCIATGIARRELLVKRQQHAVAIWLNVEVKAHTHSLRTLALHCRNLVRDFASHFIESGSSRFVPTSVSRFVL